MNRFTALLLSTLLLLPNWSASALGARPLDPPAVLGTRARLQDDPGLMRRYAAALPAGTLVRVRMTDGTRIKGTLMDVDTSGIVVKPKGRVPEPTRHVPFDRIETLEVDSGGLSTGKAVAIGVGAAVATFLTLWVVAIAALGDD